MDQVKSLALAVAIGLLSLAILLHGRFSTHVDGSTILRTDHLTGEMQVCGAADGKVICRKIPIAQ
jgi:hypothetical protein